MRFFKRPALLLIGLVLCAPARPAQAARDEVNYLEQAARLTADGNYDRAEAALRNVNREAEDFDPARYDTLAGLIALRKGDPRSALPALERACDEYDRRLSTPKLSATAQAELRTANERVHLYLGQAHMQTGEFGRALTSLDAAGSVGDGIPMVHALRAQAHWELKEWNAAFTALDRGAGRFPGDHSFLRRKIFYLIQLGFHQRAVELGTEYLRIANPQAADYLALGSALRRSGQPARALAILEHARMLYPEDRNLAVELANAWIDQGSVGAAADILAEAAIRHPDVLVEAAELQRRAGRFHRALLLNSAVPDQAKKFRQRLAIYVSMERWEMAASMGDALKRTALLSVDDIRYAYAYALFKTGALDEAELMLGGISDGELFRKAAALRSTMQSCRSERWRCL